MTAADLIRSAGERGSRAIWGYRDAVCAAAAREHCTVAPAHDLGPAQIGLHLAAAPQLMVVWRVDTGWYYLDFGQGRPLVAPTGYLDGPDPLARLLPHAADAARWISGLSDGLRTGTTIPPPPVTTELAPVLRDRLLEYGSAAVRPYLDAEPIG